MIATVMYRNPIEEWWWESGFGFWFILGLCAVLIAALILWLFGSLTDWLWKKWKGK